MPGLWFEELAAGRVIDAEWTRTVTEADNVLFCSMTMNVQKLHLDAEFAAGTEFGRPLVNSLFTLGLMIGMSVHNLTQGTTVANLGMTETVFPAPVFAGDTLHVRTTVLAARASRSRAGCRHSHLPPRGVQPGRHAGGALRPAGADAPPPGGARMMRLRSPLFAPGNSARKGRPRAGLGGRCGDPRPGGFGRPWRGKDAARAAVAALLPGLTRPGVVVRVNPRSTPFYLQDLAAVVPGRPEAVMLPKCAGAADLLALDHHLEALEAAAGSRRGRSACCRSSPKPPPAVLALATCPEAARRVRGVCFGAEDLSADLGIDPRRPDGSYPPPVALARAAVLLMAAAAGLPAIDTPWPDPRDTAGLAREAAAAAADGFAGKLCIHPDQIAPVNAAFSPSPERLAWARRVLAGFAANPGRRGIRPGWQDDRPAPSEAG